MIRTAGGQSFFDLGSGTDSTRLPPPAVEKFWQFVREEHHNHSYNGTSYLVIAEIYGHIFVWLGRDQEDVEDQARNLHASSATVLKLANIQ